MTIYIEDLSFEAVIGILPKERKKAQRVIANAKIEYKQTDVDDFLDYVKVIKFIQKKIITKKYKLLESAVRDVAFELKNDFPNIQALQLKISKPTIISNCNVAVEEKFFY